MSKSTRVLVVLLCVLACVLLLGAIQPNILGVPNSTLTTNINTASATTLVVVSGVANQNIYVTHYHLIASGTTNWSWVYGTGSNCGTGTTTLDGPLPLSTTISPGISAGVGLGAVLVVPAGKDLCFTNSAAVQVGGAITTGGPF